MMGCRRSSLLPYAMFVFISIIFAASTAPAQTGAYTLDGGTASESGQTFDAGHTDESGVFVTNGGKLTLADSVIVTTGGSSSVDLSSQYGLNAGVLANQGGAVSMTGSSVTTTGLGANGLFATGAGSAVTMNGGFISASGGNAHGVDVTYSGSITLTGVDITTTGQNSSAIATDFGGGTVKVTGGKVVCEEFHSAGIYSTGDISISGADITANGDNGAVIDVDGIIKLENTSLSGSQHGLMIHKTIPDKKTATFTASGGSISGKGGDTFLVTGAAAAITVKNAVSLNASTGVILYAEASEVNFTASGEAIVGDLIADGASTVTVDLKDGTQFTGKAALISLTLDSTSVWTVSNDTTIKSLGGGGTVKFAAPSGAPDAGSSYRSITTGGLAGNGGNLEVNARLAGDDSLSDMIVISGGKAAGSTTIKVNVTESTPDIVTGDGVKVVSTAEGGTTSAAAFTLNGGSACVGGYCYKLFRGGVNQGDSSKAGNWYLRAVADDKDGGSIDTGIPDSATADGGTVADIGLIDTGAPDGGDAFNGDSTGPSGNSGCSCSAVGIW